MSRWLRPWSTMQWQIAWRHLRGSSGAPGRSSAIILWVAGILLLVGLGFAGYAHLLDSGPEPISGADIFVTGVDMQARQRWFGLLGAGTAAVGGLLFLFGLFGRFFSLLSSIIIMSVLLGCMQLVVVLSLMSGMEQDLRDKILGQKAHIRVSSQDGRSFGDYKALVQDLAGIEGVLGAQGYLRGEVLAVNGRFQRSAVLLGVRTKDLRGVSNLDETMESGSLDAIDDPESVKSTVSKRAAVPPWRLKHLSAKKEPKPKVKASGVVKPKQGAVPTELGSKVAPKLKTLPEPGAPKPMPLHQKPASIKAVAKAHAAVLEDDEDEGWEDPMQELEIPKDAPVGGDPGEDSGQAGSDEVPADQDQAVLDAIVIGRELAKEMGGVRVGARLSLITPEGRLTPVGRVPGRKDVQVGGIFYTGLFQYDSSHAYGKLEDVQAFLRQGDRISGIEIKIHDDQALPALRQAVIDTLARAGRDQELKVETWEELNRSLFAAMLLEKIAMSIQLLCVIVVACFGILASNLMSVLEKSREIAILKAMGSSDRQIFGVFVGEGLWVGVIGAIGGVGVGLVLCALLDRYGIPFNGDMLYMDKLPVVVDVKELVGVGIAALVIVWISSLYPAYVASKVRPVDGMRKSDA